VKGTPTVVSFDGDLDIFRDSEVRSALLRVAEAECVIVDLSRVRYFGACLLGALAGLASERYAARLRAPVVVVANPRLRRLFEITGMDRIVDLCATAEQAHTLCAPVGA
jgi:anti-sigma B factor antagonist